MQLACTITQSAAERQSTFRMTAKAVAGVGRMAVAFLEPLHGTIHLLPAKRCLSLSVARLERNTRLMVACHMAVTEFKR